MAKDPAFLFYAADFITGTQFFTNEQVGKYIRLLCAQKIHGHLREKDMINICQSYDEDIFEKFDKDEEGLYYNVVLEGHIEKRKIYAESRRNNRLKAFTDNHKPKQPADKKTVKSKKDMNNISLTYDQHMENVNVNENVIKNKEDKIKKVSEKLKKEEEIFSAEVMNFADEYPESMLKAFLNYWCELNKAKTTMLWQTKPTFEIKRRLVTWSERNNKGFERTGSISPANVPVSKVEAAQSRHDDIIKDYE